MAKRALFVKLQVLLLVLATLVTISSALDTASDETKSSEKPDSNSHPPAQEDHNRYFGDGSPGEIKTGDQNQRDPTIGLFFKRDQETWLGNLKKRCRRKTNSNCMRKDHRRRRK